MGGNIIILRKNRFKNELKNRFRNELRELALKMQLPWEKKKLELDFKFRKRKKHPKHFLSAF